MYLSDSLLKGFWYRLSELLLSGSISHDALDSASCHFEIVSILSVKGSLTSALRLLPLLRLPRFSQLKSLLTSALRLLRLHAAFNSALIRMSL